MFSILPPLSILAPSSSPSPLTVTPQTVTSDVLATGTSVGWAHGNGILYSDMASEWADAAPSSASSSLPKTPATKNRSSSPSRRNSRTPSSSPPGSGSRRAESKLRSVLSVIDEAQQQQHQKQTDDDAVPLSPDAAAAVTTPAVAPATNGPSVSESAEARDSGASWTSFPFGEEEHPRSDSQNTTPRHPVSELASSTEDVSQGDAQGRQTPESDRSTSPISS